MCGCFRSLRREEDDDGPEECGSAAAGAPTGWLVPSTDGRPATKGETKGKARHRRRLTKERHDADENPLRKERRDELLRDRARGQRAAGGLAQGGAWRSKPERPEQNRRARKEQTRWYK